MIIPTNSLKIVSNLFDDVQRNSLMVGLLAKPGNGKSTLILESCKSDYKRVIVQMSKSKKAIHLYQDIYRQIRAEQRVTPNDMYELIVEISEFLVKSNKKYLVCIDEAGKLRAQHLEYFHELRENTHGKCGFVFAGPPYFKKNLIKWINNERQGMEEFGRRIDEWIELDGPTESEKAAYCRENGIHDIKTIEKIVYECETFADLVTSVKHYLRGKK